MKNQAQAFSLRAGEELNSFIEIAVDKSGRSKNAVIKACIQVARENQNGLFKKIGTKDVETAK